MKTYTQKSPQDMGVSGPTSIVASTVSNLHEKTWEQSQESHYTTNKTGGYDLDRQEFLSRWETRKNEFGRLRASVDGAALCEEMLEDLRTVFLAEDEAELTLEEAANESGYSSDHLRRLVREGKLSAIRRGRRLFFYRGDLPRKPTRVDPKSATEYDPVADARQVALRRSNGRN